MGEFSIQISSNLVNSLSGGEAKSKKKSRRLKTKSLKQNEGWPLHPPLFLPPPPPAIAELEAIRSVLEESERVVEKLQRQEQDMLHQVTQRAKDLRDKEFKLPYQKPLPCVAENQACFACYKEHVNHPLKCAHLVRTFADCARRVRQQLN